MCPNPGTEHGAEDWRVFNQPKVFPGGVRGLQDWKEMIIRAAEFCGRRIRFEESAQKNGIEKGKP
jgi:hypothetical protein